MAAGGGVAVDVADAEAVIWNFGPAAELAACLAEAPRVSWVQLVAAGVEAYAGVIDAERTWTSAKGAFAEPVAEHALALLLAGLRELPERARARAWGAKAGRSLFGARVVVLGGGGIASCLLELLSPFEAAVTVVRKHAWPMLGASAVVEPDGLAGAVAGADALVLAAAMTSETAGVVDAALLRTMGPRCWLVNVARGGLVSTPDLVEALRAGWIAGAALDVVDPEPLPDGHPLWTTERCLLTPHTANPPETEARHLARRIETNVRARLEGRPLLGVVSPDLGY